jgi:hypothetical protein
MEGHNANTKRQAVLERFSYGLKSPTGRGPQFALVHARH